MLVILGLFFLFVVYKLILVEYNYKVQPIYKQTHIEAKLCFEQQENKKGYQKTMYLLFLILMKLMITIGFVFISFILPYNIVSEYSIFISLNNFIPCLTNHVSAFGFIFNLIIWDSILLYIKSIIIKILNKIK